VHGRAIRSTREPTYSNARESFSELFQPQILLGRFIPRATRARLQVHAVEQQLQGLRRQADFGAGFPRALRPAKRAFLQTLGQHAHARAIEVKNLDPIAPAVAKDKERAAFGILAQVLLGGAPLAATGSDLNI
jgi:hypothetical protein